VNFSGYLGSPSDTTVDLSVLDYRDDPAPPHLSQKADSFSY
jgi:hypothetical protein